MTGQDLAHRRPLLLASLFFGISYYFVRDMPWPDLLLIAWKGAGVALLCAYALRRHHDGDYAILALVLGLGALGDVLLELDMIWGGTTFALSHGVAIWLYARNRRPRLSLSQRLAALALLTLTPLIAWHLPANRDDATGVAIYGLIVAAMAAAAWTSSFPRYRVGIGALFFVVSDLLIFAQMGPWVDSAIPHLLIWPLYYFGQFLIAIGVVGALRRRGPSVPGTLGP